MAKKIEYYEGKPVIVAANKKQLADAVQKFKEENPDITLEAPYVVRVKGKTVKEGAFSYCSIVGVAILQDNVKEIDIYAFFGCEGLTSIVIPDSVTQIGSLTFASCKSLTSIVVADDNPKYDSRDNCNAIIETIKNKLITGCSSTVIPNSVTEIGECAFSGCEGLASIVIPDSVTEIGKDAFSDCKGLTSIVIPDSVTEIGERAFEGCKGLTNIVISDSVTEIGEEAFFGCRRLKEVSVKDKALLEKVFLSNDVEIIERGIT